MRAGALITGYLVLLFILHQDFWLRDNPSLVFGIFPTTLAYHMAYTGLVVLGWAAVVRFAWPAGLDEEVEDPSNRGPAK